MASNSGKITGLGSSHDESKIEKDEANFSNILTDLSSDLSDFGFDDIGSSSQEDSLGAVWDSLAMDSGKGKKDKESEPKKAAAPAKPAVPAKPASLTGLKTPPKLPSADDKPGIKKPELKPVGLKLNSVPSIKPTKPGSLPLKKDQTAEKKDDKPASKLPVSGLLKTSGLATKEKEQKKEPVPEEIDLSFDDILSDVSTDKELADKDSKPSEDAKTADAKVSDAEKPADEKADDAEKPEAKEETVEAKQEDTTEENADIKSKSEEDLDDGEILDGEPRVGRNSGLRLSEVKADRRPREKDENPDEESETTAEESDAFEEMEVMDVDGGSTPEEAIDAMRLLPDPEDMIEVSDEDESAGASAESFEEGYQITERARLGLVEPECEVVTTETEIKPIFRYSPADCEPDFKDDEDWSKWAIRIIVAFVICVIVVFVIALGWYFLGDARTQLAQKFAFGNVDEVSWSSMSMSEDGRWLAVCNDGVAAIFDMESEHRAVVSEFFMNERGCKDIQVTNQATALVLAKNGDVYSFNSSKENSIVTQFYRKLKLTNIIRFDRQTDGFYTIHGRKGVYHWIQWSMEKAEQEKEIRLPEDAVICHTAGLNPFAYYSSKQLIWSNGTDQHGIPVADFNDEIVACSMMKDQSGWVVLAEDGSVRWIDSKGAVTDFKLDRFFEEQDAKFILSNDDSVEILAGKDWYHLQKDGTIQNHKLSQELTAKDSVILRDNKAFPMVALVNSRIHLVSQDGIFEQVPEPTDSLSAAYFVGDGSKAILIHNGEGARDGLSSIHLWDLRKGRLEREMPLNSRLQNVSISRTGKWGLIEFFNGDSWNIEWIDWNVMGVMGEFSSPVQVRDVQWAKDDKYLLVEFEDGRKSLYARKDAGFEFIRPYTAEQQVTFFRGTHLMVWENGILRAQNIANEQMSIPLLRITEIGANSESALTHIVSHPESRDLLMWGSAGLYAYNYADGKGRWLAEAPIEWVTFDRSGKYAASHLGVWHFTPEGDNYIDFSISTKGAVRWTGDSSAVLSNSGNVAYWATSGISDDRHNGLQYKDVACLGENCGMHPNADLMLSLRGNIVALETFNGDLIGVMHGIGIRDWCWKSDKGDVQGIGNACIHINDNVEVLNPDNGAVIGQLASVAWSKPVVNSEVLPEVQFVDWTNLKIEVDFPSDVSVFFYSADQQSLPQSLVSEKGWKAPFNGKVMRDDRAFSAVATSPGYVPQAFIFTPDSRDISWQTTLIDVYAADTEITVLKGGKEDITSTIPDDKMMLIRKAISQARVQLQPCFEKGFKYSKYDLKLGVDEMGFVTDLKSSPSIKSECAQEVFVGMRTDKAFSGSTIRFKMAFSPKDAENMAAATPVIDFPILAQPVDAEAAQEPEDAQVVEENAEGAAQTEENAENTGIPAENPAPAPADPANGDVNNPGVAEAVQNVVDAVNSGDAQKVENAVNNGIEQAVKNATAEDIAKAADAVKAEAQKAQAGASDAADAAKAAAVVKSAEAVQEAAKSGGTDAAVEAAKAEAANLAKQATAADIAKAANAVKNEAAKVEGTATNAETAQAAQEVKNQAAKIENAATESQNADEAAKKAAEEAAKKAAEAEAAKKAEEAKKAAEAANNAAADEAAKKAAEAEAAKKAAEEEAAKKAAEAEAAKKAAEEAAKKAAEEAAKKAEEAKKAAAAAEGTNAE